MLKPTKIGIETRCRASSKNGGKRVYITLSANTHCGS